MINTEIDNDEVLKAITQIAERFPELVRKALLNAGLAIEARAKENLERVHSGDLRRSIAAVIDDDEPLVCVGTNVSYAPYIHEGTGIFARNGNGRHEVPWTYRSEEDGSYHKTSGITPNPFLEDAVNSLGTDILTYFEGILERGDTD